MKRALLVGALVFGVAALALLPRACARVPDPTLDPPWDAATAAPAPPPKAALPRNPDRSLFWGDLHIHTSLSSDAWTMGVRARPDDAYTFAKGGSIPHAAGYALRISRPLDFAAVTDHAEMFGVMQVAQPDAPLAHRSLRDLLKNGTRLEITRAWLGTALGVRLRDADLDPETIRRARTSAWQEIQAAAARHDAPGVFTAFVGYEWTGDETNGLHRNIVYGGANVPELPFSAVDSPNPEDLWRALEAQKALGQDAIAISHNGNLSNGRMYTKLDHAGRPLSRELGELRARTEPISEILQVKGASETHPLLSNEDEFANFEIHATQLSAAGSLSQPSGSYARDALRTGLELSHSEGFNPYRFGVIGSSDGHNASSPVEEASFHGKLPMMDGSAALRLNLATLIPASQHRPIQWSAAGLAAVWAEENTRAALFDALRRRETYATSGPRIQVRFYGGWNYDRALLEAPDFVQRARREGVPMGGQLPPAPAGASAPRFAVSALKDPAGANLDRVQVIKGWVDASGASHERIFDLAASRGRARDAKTGHFEPVGSTVDVAAARYTNAIGAASLGAVWSDPEFDPDVEAFYYARVIEIPTPRWSTYDAMRLGVPAPEPTRLQERAITSAIWYAPGVDARIR